MKRDTVCRLCSACCPVMVEIENGRLVGAVRKSSVPAEHRLPCPKLQAAPEIVYSRERVRTPLIRADRGRDFYEASWEEALAVVAQRFEYFKKRYGPQSVCWLRGMAADWGAPWDYVNRLMNLFGSPNTIGNGSVCHVAREMAHVLTYGAMTVPDQKNSRCIIVWGKNDRDTNPAAYEGISLAKAGGAVLIVIDPIRTRLAEMADLWLQIRPGCDGLLAMAMIHEIIGRGWYDEAFVREWTVGFEALRKGAAPYSPEAVAPRIWLDPAAIRAAARLYAESGPASIIEGNGLDMQLHIFDNTRAICILRGLTGNLDRPGGDLLPQPVPVKNLQMKDRLPSHIPPITRDYPLFNEFHETWGRQVQSCVIDAILDEKPYPVRMLVVQSANPVVTMTDANRVVEAMKRLECLVVIDPFMTRTARLAHVVLPAGTCFEKTQLNRAYMRNNPVILQNQVIDWVGESRPDWKIVFDLGRRLGFGREFPWQTAEEAIDEHLGPAGLTVEQLRQHPDGIRLEEVAYEKYKEGGFATPSRKMELFSETLRSHGCPPVPSFEEDAENRISFYERREEFPLIGISGARSRCFTHSQFRFVPSLANRQGECVVDVHPDDAGREGISDGDLLKVETPKGHILMRAKVSRVVHPGSIRIAWGWGEYNPDFNLNNLTDDDHRNRVTGTPSNRTFMCRITKVA